MSLVILVPSIGLQITSLLHGGVPHQLVNLCFLLRRLWQALHQFEAKIAFLVQYGCAFPWTVINEIWFGASEVWRNGNVTAFQEYVQTEMMSVQGPAPGFVGRWLSEQQKVVGILVHDSGHFAYLTKEMIDAHGRESLFVSFRRECGGDDAKD
ncbi:hypothetical protein AC578_5491 [Pseudocercospora eumusae]|uniref:Uncharacterized protein n=1 Tax=Pseudocercospora eumusae TaxID=321146 RepID=A0A139H1B1_9PEZI|nr:hypothetical protein AC578_5491 [Pseudocercospora eumusae]